MTLHFVIRTKHSDFDKKARRLGSKRIPVYVRIKDGKEVDQTLRTEILVNPFWWDSRLEEVSMNSKCPVEEMIQTNRALSDLRGKLIVDYLSDKRRHNVNPAWLKNHLNPSTPGIDGEDIIELIRQYCTEKKISEVRKASYLSLGRALKRYEAFRVRYDNRDFVLDISQIDSDFLAGFQDYLGQEASLYDTHTEFFRSIGLSRHPRPRSLNTTIDLFKKFRAFYRWHAMKGHGSGTAFSDFVIAREVYGTPVCLTKEEICTIKAASMPTRDLETARDIFVFQCNVGCRVGDLMRLSRSNVSDGTLSYIPSKSSHCSGRRVLVPLNEVARSIVEKYADSCGMRLLPCCSVHRYNYAIKRILRISGVDRMVTVLDPLSRKERQVPIHMVASSHMARRSFINNLYGRVKDSALVASLTGHVEGSHSFFRYREISTDIKRDLVALLE